MIRNPFSFDDNNFEYIQINWPSSQNHFILFSFFFFHILFSLYDETFYKRKEKKKKKHKHFDKNITARIKLIHKAKILGKLVLHHLRDQPRNPNY